MIGHGARTDDDVRVGDRAWCMRTYGGVRIGDRAWCIKQVMP